LHEQQTQELLASNTWAQDLEAKLQAAASRVIALQNELDEQQRMAIETVRGYETHMEETRRDLEARTQWARDLEVRVNDASEELTRCVALLDRAEATVVERTKWAQDLQRQLEEVQALFAGLSASGWIKLGRVLHLGPELPS
jgi:hypothetical protein